ncbi:YqhA family protein [Cyanobium sp. HWJ4-Hawea]|uniref:YqhA family protein n=1 Tax=Cyanobium sp. HWJ4-Hawea TaxID=2823713 RepID=UPI0020CD4C8E|nr:YqhA family protein [Cyanobium sp. HWJ4-Hawea]
MGAVELAAMLQKEVDFPMQEVPQVPRRSRLAKQLELRLERMIWRFRLIAIVPVLMSLLSTLLTFAIGTREIFYSIGVYFEKPGGHAEISYYKALAGVVSGIDFYLIGVALLIFGYGLYELLLSPLDAYREETNHADGSGLLDIKNLDQLKEKLVKVLIVALIVSAFKAMLSIEVKDVQTLAYFCLCVLALALSSFLLSLKVEKKH